MVNIYKDSSFCTENKLRQEKIYIKRHDNMKSTSEHSS